MTLAVLTCVQIGEGSSNVRGDDTGTLKKAMQSYLPRNVLTDVVYPPIPAIQDKSERGFNHPQIAALMCPRKFKKRFVKNEAQ